MSLDLGTISYWWGYIGCWIAFSFAFLGSTKIYQIVECYTIGLTLAYTVHTNIDAYHRNVITPLSKNFAGNIFMVVIPAIIGVLVFTRLTRQRWLSRYPRTIQTVCGLAIGYAAVIKAQVVDQVLSTMSDAATGTPDRISGLLILVGFLTCLTYFIYTVRFSTPFHQQTSPLRWINLVGRFFMMISFGYLFCAIFLDEGVDLIAGGLLTQIFRPLVKFGLKTVG